MSRQQTPSLDLGVIVSPERIALDKAFVAQCAALEKRPEPRSLWDEVARTDHSVAHPAAKAVGYSKRAMRSALQTTDPDIIAQTERSIRDYYDACRDAALSELRGVVLCPSAAFVAFVKEAGEAVHATAQAHITNSPTLWERAKRELREAGHAIRVLMESRKDAAPVSHGVK